MLSPPHPSDSHRQIHPLKRLRQLIWDFALNRCAILLKFIISWYLVIPESYDQCQPHNTSWVELKSSPPGWGFHHHPHPGLGKVTLLFLSPRPWFSSIVRIVLKMTFSHDSIQNLVNKRSFYLSSALPLLQ